LDVTVNGAAVEAVGLVVALLDPNVQPVLKNQSVSIDYGQMRDSVSACWKISGKPRKLTWQIKSVLSVAK